MKLRQLGIALALLVVLALAAAPTLLYPLTRDQGAYAYIADLMMHGGVPYRDGWDLKPPAIYFVYQLAFSLFGRSESAVRLMDIIFALLSAVSVGVLAGEVFGDRRIAWGAAWVYAFSYYFGVHFYAVANPESFMVPLLVAACYGVARGMRCQEKLPWFVAGLASGLGFWFKPTSVVVTSSLLAWAALEMVRRHRETRDFARALAAVAAGSILGLLSFGLYLRGHGLAELLELWRFYGATAYASARGLALGDGPLAALDVVVRYIREWQLLVWLTLAGAVGVQLRRHVNPGAPAVTVFLLSAVAAVLVQGKLFEYHWIPALAPAAVLSAASLIWLGREIQLTATGGRWREMRSILAVVVIVGLVLYAGYESIARLRRLGAYAGGRISRAQYDVQFDIGDDFSHTATLDAAEYLRGHTSEDETVLIWGAEPLVNFLAERRSPTKYIFSYMLFDEADDSRLEARRQDFLAELDRAPPEYVVLVENDVTPLTPEGSEALLEAFPSLGSLLESEYSLETQVEDYAFYRRD